MEKIIQKINDHRIIATIIAVLICAAIIVVIFLLSGSPEKKNSDFSSAAETIVETDYFEDSDYPVHVKASDSKISIKLDGSKTPDLTWDTAIEPGGIIYAENDAKEDKGVLNSDINPKGGGYVTVTYTRTAEIAGRKLNVAKIDVDIIATAADDGTISVAVSDIRQELSSSGAVDTDTPYLLEGNKVILPNGGDWVLVTPKTAENTYPDYTIYQGYDEDDHFYYSVTRNLTVNSDPEISDDTSSEAADETVSKPASDASAAEQEADNILILKSESLKIEQKLSCTLDDNREWKLSIAED